MPELSSAPRTKKHLLVIEDAPDQIIHIQSALQPLSNRIEVHVAKSAREAVEWLDDKNHRRPDAIVIGLHFRWGGGDSLLAELHKDPRFKDVLLIVETDHEANQDRVEAVNAGANAYICKDDERRRLVEMLRYQWKL